ncbi:unnamed protein product [Penicillium glandicola]
MVAPGSQWPPLSGGRENSARNINERILDANYDVRQLLNHISSNNSVKVPRPVLEYLKSIQDLTADLIKNPIGQDWKQQFEQLRQETSQIKQDIHAALTSPAAPRQFWCCDMVLRGAARCCGTKPILVLLYGAAALSAAAPSQHQF